MDLRLLADLSDGGAMLGMVSLGGSMLIRFGGYQPQSALLAFVMLGVLIVVPGIALLVARPQSTHPWRGTWSAGVRFGLLLVAFGGALMLLAPPHQVVDVLSWCGWVLLGVAALALVGFAVRKEVGYRAGAWTWFSFSSPQVLGLRRVQYSYSHGHYVPLAADLLLRLGGLRCQVRGHHLVAVINVHHPTGEVTKETMCPTCREWEAVRGVQLLAG